MFTVDDMNPDIHVYKIKDATGCTKVVLEVNFLPIPGIDEGSSSSETDQPLICAESNQDDYGVDQTTMTSRPDIPDFSASNVEMLTVLSAESSSQSFSYDSDKPSVCEPAFSPVTDMTLPGDLTLSLHSDVADTVNLGITQYPGAADELSKDEGHGQHSDEIAQNLPPSPNLLCTDSSLQADAHTCAELVKPVKTRVGGIVKSVNRLIESMVQIPVSRVQDV